MDDNLTISLPFPYSWTIFEPIVEALITHEDDSLAAGPWPYRV